MDDIHWWNLQMMKVIREDTYGFVIITIHYVRFAIGVRIFENALISFSRREQEEKVKSELRKGQICHVQNNGTYIMLVCSYGNRYFRPSLFVRASFFFSSFF